MEVVKSLNNSLILSKDSKGNELIVMGKGLGFDYKIGQHIPNERIEKIFTLDSLSKTLQKDYIDLMENISDELIIVVQKIIDYASDKMQFNLNKNLVFTLVDHLNYAIERFNKEIILQNKLLPEIQNYYPQEYAVGVYGIRLIQEYLNVSLPAEEAGNIAFHIVNAQNEKNELSETILSIRVLKDILTLLKYLFPEKKIDQESMIYLRFVTHLQFFINRMIKKELLPEKDEFLLESVKTRFGDAYQASIKIKAYVEDELQVQVNKDELLYLALHISRVYSK